MGKNVLRSSVAKLDVVVNIEIRAPVTDLRHTLKLLDLQHGVVVTVVNGQRLLVLLNPLSADRFREVAERAVSDGSAGLGCNTVGGEFVDAFGSGV